MKKIALGIVLVSMLFCLIGCGGSQVISAKPGSDRPTTNSTTQKTTQKREIPTPAELDAEISKQPVRVIETNYVVQHEEYKSLYPDMLQAIIQNDSAYDIKDAVVAFVAWDEHDLPVKIEGQYDFGSISYVKKCNFKDINLVPGDSYGHDSGMALDSDSNNIKKMKAIVVSYETFDGETWDNPFFKIWRRLYEGKRYSE